MTPLQALWAGMVIAAEVFGIAGECGTVEVGKRADLVGTLASPMDEIRVLQSPKFVMQAGRLVAKGWAIDRLPAASFKIDIPGWPLRG